MSQTSTMKKLGFWFIVLFAINSIIGSGIFLTPGSVVSMVGAKAPLAYLGAAVIAIVLAISFASAAKYVSKSGGAYAYSKASFGNRFGFYMGVVRYFSASVAWGVMAVSVIKSTLSIFGGNPNDFTSVSIGFVVLMAIITLVNFLGEDFFTWVNNLSTIGELTALGILLVTGQNNFSNIDSLTGSVIPPVTTSSFVMATVAAFYAFTGFESVSSGSEDMVKPEKNLPQAIPLAIIIISFIYIGTIAVAMAINPVAIVKTNHVVALAAVFTNRVLQTIILLGALISMFGINVAASFNSPRILEAMANEGQMPYWIAKRNRKGIPIVAYIITVALAILIPMSFLYETTLVILMSAMVRFFEFICIPIGVVGYYYGKHQQPILKAPKNWWTDVLIPILGVILTAFLLFEYDWVGEFSIHGHLNWYAISGMIGGFVVLPIIFAVFARIERRRGALHARVKQD